MAVKAMADMTGQMPKLGYKEAAGLFKNFSSGPAFTFNASYLTRIKENDYSQLIEGAYVIYPSEASQTVIEMIALPKHFCISINQGGETSVYADAFCHVLQENGISCEVENILYGNTGYIEIREYEKWL